MDKKRFEELFSWPDDYPLPTPRFGKGPSEPKDLPQQVLRHVGKKEPRRQEFRIEWSDDELGLQVLVREREDGEIWASASSTEDAYLGKAVSVALAGQQEHQRRRITVPLDQKEEPKGCRGAARFFRRLEELRAELGSTVSLGAFLLA
jgi:hypothetical protein